MYLICQLTSEDIKHHLKKKNWYRVTINRVLDNITNYDSRHQVPVTRVLNKITNYNNWYQVPVNRVLDEVTNYDIRYQVLMFRTLSILVRIAANNYVK